MDKPKPEPRSSVANIVGKYDKGLEDLLKQLSHIDLTDDVHDQDAYLDAHGGYCDVFIAKSRRHGERVVAIKRLRVHILHHKDVAKMLFRELTIWSSLDHPNVLPLLGYVMHGKYPALISEWMGNGTMKRYMEDHPEVSVMNMAKGIAAGLLHLHELNVVHSDLKSDNILISEDGQPLLADFGISRIMTASLSVTTTTAAPKGSVRWMAIELLEVDLSGEQSFGKPAVHTKMTDVWSYGMVIYELLTSQYPYAHLRHELQVSMAIINGQTPERPTDLKNREEDLMWLVCQKCWQADPLHRPDMGRLCNVLRHETAMFKQYEGVSADSRSVMDRLQHFTLWDNPHREVFWEEPIPQSPGGWRIVLSDITLRCQVVGRR
ncbi:kinase-like protein [Schizopora paradoxa]|uniref:Kinase-like protein n=1 Tax=Schizopora paradoxa TaxID=27342 RepID=A0A0H2R9Y6_9AGAM|nr:kinase-like protein [Schizopora paradoxa]